jgi:hypothetical protein
MPLAIIANWMYHSRLRKLISDWYRRSQGENIREFDIFDKFASLWISFNAWETYESQEESDRDKIEWAKENPALKQKYSELIANNNTFKEKVLALQSLCPIYRNKPYNGSREVRIANLVNFGEVLEAIYVIRCNFFHGEKSPDEPRDIKLTELAFSILSEVFSVKIAEISSSDW